MSTPVNPVPAGARGQEQPQVESVDAAAVAGAAADAAPEQPVPATGTIEYHVHLVEPTDRIVTVAGRDWSKGDAWVMTAEQAQAYRDDPRFRVHALPARRG